MLRGTGRTVATRRTRDGYSYGGAVTSEAGTHLTVSALVYIAAFAPDKGESVNTLIADPPPHRRPSTPSPNEAARPSPKHPAVTPSTSPNPKQSPT
jgi:hypothetical protein